jgi:AcrR family transcriptional regulator
LDSGGQAPTKGRGTYGSTASRGAAEGVSPLYKRLPHGPHRLDRKQVALHQRARIHGAMVEAVSRSGYEGTSVKQVIGLAGVSRRSFYELFANKQECFLATFDLLVHREIQKVRRVYLATDGELETRLRAVFEACATVAQEDRNAALLVLVDAQTAGAAGTLRLCRASAVCEQLLGESLAQAPASGALTPPILRAIAGGMHGAVSTRLRREPAEGLAEGLIRWTLSFQTPRAIEMSEQLSKRTKAQMREIAFEHAERPKGLAPQEPDERLRLLQAVLRLAARHEHKELTAPQIADEARVSIDTFFELFENKDECFLAALDMVGEELLSIAADPGLDGEDWPGAVRRVLAAMLAHLARNPLHARALVQDAYNAGERAFRRNLDLAEKVGSRLTAGAPSQPLGSLSGDAVAGALWHMVRYQVTDGRTQALPALSDHLSFVVLAPFIGADAAVEMLSEEMVL